MDFNSWYLVVFAYLGCDCQLANGFLTQSVVTEVEFCSMIHSVLRLRLRKHAPSMADAREHTGWQKPSMPLKVSMWGRYRACLLTFSSISQSRSHDWHRKQWCRENCYARRREWKIPSGIPYHEGSFSMLSVLCHFFLVLSSSAWQSAFHNVAPWTSQPQSSLLFHTTLILEQWASHNSMDLVCKPVCFQTLCHPNASYILVLEVSWMSYTLSDPVQPFPLPGMFFTSFSIASWILFSLQGPILLWSLLVFPLSELTIPLSSQW